MKQSLAWAILGTVWALACSSSGGDGARGTSITDAGSGGALGSTGGMTATGGAIGSGGTRSSTGGSSAGGSGGGSGKMCGAVTCTGAQVCVAHRTVGGAYIPVDGGYKCPTGTHLEPLGGTPEHCVADFTYDCLDLPGCTPTEVSCHCGTSSIADTMFTCPMAYPACSLPTKGTPWLAPSAQLICEQDAP